MLLLFYDNKTNNEIIFIYVLKHIIDQLYIRVKQIQICQITYIEIYVGLYDWKA